MNLNCDLYYSWGKYYNNILKYFSAEKGMKDRCASPQSQKHLQGDETEPSIGKRVACKAMHCPRRTCRRLILSSSQRKNEPCSVCCRVSRGTTAVSTQMLLGLQEPLEAQVSCHLLPAEVNPRVNPASSHLQTSQSPHYVCVTLYFPFFQNANV